MNGIFWNNGLLHTGATCNSEVVIGTSVMKSGKSKIQLCHSEASEEHLLVKWKGRPRVIRSAAELCWQRISNKGWKEGKQMLMNETEVKRNQKLIRTHGHLERSLSGQIGHLERKLSNSIAPDRMDGMMSSGMMSLRKRICDAMFTSPLQ